MSDRHIFVNLPVADLDKTKAFFAALGFEFNPQFTDDNAACMVVSDKGFVMLLQRAMFETFTDNAICDTATHTEALVCFSCDSREEVDAMVAKAIENGGRHAKKPMDYGFMYGWSFYDPDGHHWEVFWMDPNANPGAAS